MALGASSSRLIRSIKAPLGFFALALLIIEGFLGTVSWKAVDKIVQIAAMLSGAVMYILVVVLVFLLAWFKQPNLVEPRGYPTPGPESGTKKPKRRNIKKKPALEIKEVKVIEP